MVRYLLDYHHNNLQKEEIIEHCRERLAGYKIPASVSFVPELPKNTSGKILKWVLREEYWKDREVKV